jgi:hypothetical protein
MDRLPGGGLTAWGSGAPAVVGLFGLSCPAAQVLPTLKISRSASDVPHMHKSAPIPRPARRLVYAFLALLPLAGYGASPAVPGNGENGHGNGHDNGGYRGLNKD